MIELTRLTKDGGPLTKRIYLSPDGTLVKDGSACVMGRGVAERVRLAGVDELAALIEGLTPSQALALGALRPGLLDKVEVTQATLADPLEGVAYGTCKALIMRREDGSPWIHSFAHGRTIYELKHDAASVHEAIEKAAKGDVVATFSRVAASADLGPIELEELRQLAKKKSGVGLRVIDAALKSVQQQRAAQNAKGARTRQAAQRQDPRPVIQCPFSDEPFLPVMSVLNEVIGKVIAARPPSRDINDDATRVRKLPVPDTHVFSASEVNVEPEEKTDD
jgi:hypothetical protein